MSGTVIGGKRAAKTNKARYGESFYKDIGSLYVESWIANGRKPKGFAAVPGLAARAGKLGGRKSKRGPAKPKIIVITPPRRFWDIRRRV